MLGVNLEANSPRLAKAEADAFLTAFGRRYIDALDIGNEPPLYSGMPWYRTQGREIIPWYDDVGTAVFGRSLSWGPPAFVTDYARILSVLPPSRLPGPTPSGRSGSPPTRAFCPRTPACGCSSLTGTGSTTA